MSWNIVFFETPRGEKPVKEFMKAQQPQAKAKIAHMFDLLEEYGSFLGMPHAKRIDDKLFELRVRGKQEIRIVYAFRKQTAYLLHAFKKQTQKTPQRELDIALKRLDII